MKKIISFIFLILLLISVKNVSAQEINTASDNRSITNINNIVINEDLFLTLLNAGYSVDEVYNMTLDDLQNANLTPLENSTAKYYRVTTITRYGVTSSFSEEITEEEYNKAEPSQPSIRAEGSVENAYKYLRAFINPDGSLMKYRVYMYWKTIPSNRSNDIIGMGYQPSYVQYASSVYFSQIYTKNYATHTDNSHIPKRTTTGAGAVFELPSGTITTLCQDMYILVNKKDSSQTITTLQGAGDYAHATTTVTDTEAQNYTINHAGGLVLNSSISNKYDSISAAIVNWYGTW